MTAGRREVVKTHFFFYNTKLSIYTIFLTHSMYIPKMTPQNRFSYSSSVRQCETSTAWPHTGAEYSRVWPSMAGYGRGDITSSDEGNINTFLTL
ncbi:hypothetical protein AB205_0062780 [Aquarana catesbeiana]|uniref:Uncharacterized protein n=1 Tax=Aquarana catesbeiana TaxID=8400 RepID=A0A2G9RKN1_AQUCT|nr:hypothetical protein AB205_0062780 [Aquarana catesbeiana]